MPPGKWSFGPYWDFTIECQDRRFRVHKMQIVASEVFAKAINGPFFEEARTDTISLHDEDPDAVEAFLYCMYHGSPAHYIYSCTNVSSNASVSTTNETHDNTHDEPSDAGEPIESLQLDHVILLASLADKYGAKCVLHQLGAAFQESLFHCRRWRGVWSMAEVLRLMPRLYDALPSSNRTLRGPLVRQVVREYSVLLRQPTVRPDATKAIMLDCLARASRACPDFGAEVMRALGLVARPVVPMPFAAPGGYGQRVLRCLECGLYFAYALFEDLECLCCDEEKGTFLCDGCLFSAAGRDWVDVHLRIAAGQVVGGSGEGQSMQVEEA